MSEAQSNVRLDLAGRGVFSNLVMFQVALVRLVHKVFPRKWVNCRKNIEVVRCDALEKRVRKLSARYS